MQHLTNHIEVPPGKFPFVCPECGWSTKELSKEDLFNKIEKHYKANNHFLPDNWKQVVENRICESLPPGWCGFEDGRPGSGTMCSVTADMIIHGVSSLSKLVWEKFTGQDIFVDKEESDKRAEICAKCHLNMETNACMGCGAMSMVIDTAAKIRQKRTTKWDHLLRNCCICGCRNDTIVHIRKDILQTGEASDMTNRRPSWCWVKNDSLEDSKKSLSL
jgi:hypothetical protein